MTFMGQPSIQNKANLCAHVKFATLTGLSNEQLYAMHFLCLLNCTIGITNFEIGPRTKNNPRKLGKVFVRINKDTFSYVIPHKKPQGE